MPDAAGDFDIPLAWGKKRGVSKDKGVQFYASFTYDGVEYSLHDHVFLFKEGVHQPFVGKLVKIWETSAGKRRRRVKVHWLFRPSEIAPHLGDTTFEPNELFLAAGDGAGVSNVNELEAIGGKCIVICTSKDERNLQPSQEDLEMADYTFYRTFDVGTLKISDKIGDSIQGVEGKFFFNSKEQMPGAIVKVEDGRVEPCRAAEGGLNGAAPQIEEKPQPVKVKAPVDICDDRPSKKAKLEVDQQVKTEQKRIRDSEKDTAVASGTSDEKIKNITNKEPVEVDKKARESLKLDNQQNKLLDGSFTRSTPTSDAIKDSIEVDKRASENLKLNNIQTHRPDGSLRKPVPDSKAIIDKQVGSDFAECSRRPETDRSKWFADLPWDTKMKNAYDQDRLVMLDNLDPEYSQAEIEDLLFQIFKQNCSVRLIEQSTFSNPHHGQALAIFKTSEAADQAVQRLNKEILMLSNGRPLIASKGITRSPDQKSAAIIGMLSLEKYAKQRKLKEDQRKAAFASHYSQANTIEYEMAIEWMLLHTKEQCWWEELHEANRQEIKKLAGNSRVR